MLLNVKKFSVSTLLAAGALLFSAGLSGCGETASPESLLADARQYQQRGEFSAAIIQLKNAVTISPDDMQLRLLLANAYADAGDPVTSEKEIRKALSLGLPGEKAMPVLAAALREQGEFVKLLVETEGPNVKRTPEVLALRGDAYLATKKLDKALEAYNAALKAQSDCANAQLGLARLALYRGDPDGALQQVDTTLAAHPKDVDALLLKAKLLRAFKKVDLAMATYDQLLTLRPEHPTAHVDKAAIAIDAGKFDVAKTELAAARQRTPNSLIVRYTGALLDYSLGNYASAHEAAQKIVGVVPQNMPSVLLAAFCEMNLGLFQQAQLHLKQYLKTYPQNLRAQKVLALAMMKNGNSSEAIGVLAPLLTAQSNDPQVLTLAGDAQMQAHDFAKATGYIEKATQLHPKSASLRASLARSKIGSGNPSGALADLERATALDPQSEVAAKLRIETEMKLGHYDKAMIVAQQMEKNLPHSAMVQNLKGGIYMAKADARQARASFETALALQPSFFSAVVNLAQLDILERQPEAAKKRFETVLEKDANNLDAMYALADLAVAQGKNAEATVWLERANKQNQESVKPASVLGLHYMHIGQKEKALALMRKVQISHPANPDVLGLLGQAQLANHDPAGSLETYAKLVNVAPQSAEAQYRLAGVEMMMNHNDAAERHLKKALALQADYLPAQLARAELAVRQGRPEVGIELARQIQKQNPKAAVGQALEGGILLIQAKPAPAAQAYARALALDDGAATLAIKLHQTMTLAGNGKDADRLFAQWRARHPQDLATAKYLAETHLTQKQYKQAIDDFEALQKKMPNNPDVLNNLAFAYQQEKDSRALGTADQALKLAPDNPIIMDTLGWILVEQGNTARGLPLLQKASDLSPNSTELHYHLALGLIKAGEKASAKKQLEKLLAGKSGFPRMADARTALESLR